MLLILYLSCSNVVLCVMWLHFLIFVIVLLCVLLCVPGKKHMQCTSPIVQATYASLLLKGFLLCLVLLQAHGHSVVSLGCSFLPLHTREGLSTQSLDSFFLLSLRPGWFHLMKSFKAFNTILTEINPKLIFSSQNTSLFRNRQLRSERL